MFIAPTMNFTAHVNFSSHKRQTIYLVLTLTRATDKTKAYIHHFNHSSQTTEKLIQAQNLLTNVYEGKCVGVVDNVVTRWWSTHDAIERIVHLKEAIHLMRVNSELDKLKDELTDDDWSNLKQILCALKPFKVGQQLLEGQKYVTVSALPFAVKTICDNLNTLIANNPDGIGKLACSLLTNFNNRWKTSEDPVYEEEQGLLPKRRDRNCQVGIHPIITVATFLDPRWKQLIISIPDAQSRTAIENNVLKLMICMEMERVDNDRSETSKHTDVAGGQGMQESHGDQTNDSMYDIFDKIQQQQEKAAQEHNGGEQNNGVSEIEVQCNNELERYKIAKGLPMFIYIDSGGEQAREYTDPLGWWKDNHHRFPILAKMARIYLAVQPTSAPAERVFSRASRLLSANRSAMSPELASKTFFVSENWEFFENQVILAEVEFTEEAEEGGEDNKW